MGKSYYKDVRLDGCCQGQRCLGEQQRKPADADRRLNPTRESQQASLAAARRLRTGSALIQTPEEAKGEAQDPV